MREERKVFYMPDELLKAVEKKVKDAKNKGEPIDYFTFVPDGEPTRHTPVGYTKDGHGDHAYSES